MHLSAPSDHLLRLLWVGLVLLLPYAGLLSPAATFTYDLAGNRTKKVLENSTTNLLSFDALNRLTGSTHQGTNGTLGSFGYGYDRVHRRTYMQVDASLGDVFAYDDTDQVTGVQYDATNPDTTPSSPARTVSYGFDPVGNRTNVTDNGAGTSYTANNLNQYTAVGAASPTYDANGNLTNYSGWGYAYDAQNRLWGAANSNTTGIFTYDARNRVVSRVVNGTTNYYFYDDWNLVSDRDAAGNPLQTYVHGPRVDEILFKTDGSNVVYYHYDALGNVTHLSDSYSRVVERYRYDIYGKATIKDGGGNTLTATAYGNRFQFTGREYLADFGLHDYRNRVYLQTWGRFIQTDPIRFDAKDVNIYRYCSNLPVLGTDPSGLDGEFSGMMASMGISGTIQGGFGALSGGKKGFVNGFIGGAIAGGIGQGLVVAKVGAMVANVIASAVGSGVEAGLNGNSITYGAVGGALGGVIGTSMIGHLNNTAVRTLIETAAEASSVSSNVAMGILEGAANGFGGAIGSVAAGITEFFGPSLAGTSGSSGSINESSADQYASAADFTVTTGAGATIEDLEDFF